MLVDVVTTPSACKIHYFLLMAFEKYLCIVCVYIYIYIYILVVGIDYFF